MARPKDKRPLIKIVVPLSLRAGRDDDLIELLQHCENRSALIKAALRGHDVGVDFGTETDEYDDMLDDLVL